MVFCVFRTPQQRPANSATSNEQPSEPARIVDVERQKYLTPKKPGSPWENGYVESFNGTLRDKLLDCEIFYTLIEAKVLIERWRREYNTVRPHSALGYRPPAPEAVRPVSIGGFNGFNMSAVLL